MIIRFRQSLLLQFGISALAVLVGAGCGSSGGGTPANQIGPSGGTVSVGSGPVSGASVTVPAGALASPILVNNLTIVVHQRGSEYTRQDQSQPGTVATMANISSFEDIAPFIGIGTELRFSSSDWVELGGKRYRNGGFRITEAEFVFLPGTEFLQPDGSKVIIVQ